MRNFSANTLSTLGMKQISLQIRVLTKLVGYSTFYFTNPFNISLSTLDMTQISPQIKVLTKLVGYSTFYFTNSFQYFIIDSWHETDMASNKSFN